MRNFIKELAKIEFVFDLSYLNKKTNYFIIGSLEGNLINQIVYDKKKFILDISKKKINLAFFLNIFNLINFIKLSLYENFVTAYYDLYIRSLKCKCVLTFYDNDINFYKLKKNLIKIKFISIQNGSRHFLNDLFGLDDLRLLKNLKADYIFVHNENIKKLYLKYIEAKIIVIGSYKNNFIQKKLINSKNKLNLAYISQYREHIFLGKKKIYWKGSQITFKDYYKNESILMKTMTQFCKQNNLNFHIICSSNSVLEKKYFKKLCGNSNIIFIPKSKNALKIYKIIDNFNIIVCSWSTLGYEALTRNIKICFFRQKIKDLHDRSFGWPSSITKDTFFYTDNVNEKRILEILKNLKKMPNSEWISKIGYFKKQVMSYDLNNKKLIKIINNV